MSKHKWVYCDDILTFYLYRYNTDNLITLKSVAEHIGFLDTGSLKMRIKNFQAVDGCEGGLKNYAKLTKQVYDDYRATSKEIHRNKCLEIMNNRLTNHST